MNEAQKAQKKPHTARASCFFSSFGRHFLKSGRGFVSGLIFDECFLQSCERIGELGKVPEGA
jgi:hypothetical protein